MKHFYVHDQYGRILRSGYCSEDVFGLQAAAGETLLECAAGDASTEMWVDAGQLKHKTPFAGVFDRASLVADSDQVATLAGIPAGSILDLNGVEQDVTGGAFALPAAQPGRHCIKLWAPQHFEWTAFVDVV